MRRTKPAAAYKRLLALALCVAIAAVSLAAVAYLAAHAGHAHDHLGRGSGCAVCAQLDTAQSLLRQLHGVLPGLTLAILALLGALSLLYHALRCCHFATPVILKVRLNN
jgi:hypothetical protein